MSKGAMQELGCSGLAQLQAALKSLTPVFCRFILIINNL